MTGLISSILVLDININFMWKLDVKIGGSLGFTLQSYFILFLNDNKLKLKLEFSSHSLEPREQLLSKF